MITLRGTQKFISFSGCKPQVVSDPSASSLEWYVNLLFFDRKKCLLVTHSQTLFTFIVMDVRKKDALDLLELFRKGLSKAMFYMHCPSEMMQKVLKSCDGILLAKTMDRSVLSSMNDMAYKVPWWLSKAEPGQDPEAAVAIRLNGMPMGALKYKCPVEMFSASYGFQVKPDLKGIFANNPPAPVPEIEAVPEGDRALPDLGGRVPAHVAQDMIYDAWECDDPKKRALLARKALAIYPHCADAYVLLADGAKYVDEAVALYLQGVKAGRLALGETFFKDNAGSLWVHLEARPYMRALAGLQESYWENREHEKAIAICYDVLRLNKNDNQGMRYVLIRYLAKLSRYDELKAFMEHSSYAHDCIAEWCFTRAWLCFIREGHTQRATELLQRAMQTNRFIPEYLFRKGYRLKMLPAHLSMGGEDEAQCYAHQFGSIWRRSSAVMKWLREQMVTTTFE